MRFHAYFAAVRMLRSCLERLGASVSEFVGSGWQRCTSESLWRCARAHHKLLCLTDDSQRWAFSAPERAAVAHLSAWLNAALLALLLGGGAPRRPYETCAALGAMCPVGAPQLWAALLAGLLSVPPAALVQTCCRGRSFLARTAALSAAERESAFLRHFLGPWPMVLRAPREAQDRRL